MKRSGTKAKYSPMEQSNVYQVQFTTISEDLLVWTFLFLAKLVSGLDLRVKAVWGINSSQRKYTIAFI